MIASQALAMAPQGGQNVADSSMYSIFYNLFPFIMVLFILWISVFRPQKQKLKAHQAMLEALAKGDVVKTDSGIHGSIQKLSEDSVTLEIAPKISVVIDRARIGELVKSK